MPKYIVVPATGRETDAPVFAMALAAARLFAAHLEFLHVRLDVQQALIDMVSPDVAGGAGYDQIIGSLEQDAAMRQSRAELAVRKFCEREHLSVSGGSFADLPSAEWRTETGGEPAWLAKHGRAADLLVVGRAGDNEAVATDVLEAALYGYRPPGVDRGGE